MSRVHGDKKIVRRPNIDKKANYKEYLKDLRIDFQDICGYCGKPTRVGFLTKHMCRNLSSLNR